MSNIDSVNALLTAIHFDRFAEIEARHAPDAVFHSFRGPTLRDSVSIADWHRDFLRDYADCNYGELEYIEQGNVVAVRATVQAKGYDWRALTQRVVEVFEFEGDGGLILARRLYAMQPDLEFDKPATASFTDATGYKGGSASATKTTIDELLEARLAAEPEAAKAPFNDKVTVVDGVYGMVSGVDNALAVLNARPRPVFGVERATRILAGEHDAVVEIAVDESRPREAQWVRIVDGKVRMIEVYWMLREIGVSPSVRQRHTKQVILPI